MIDGILTIAAGGLRTQAAAASDAAARIVRAVPGGSGSRDADGAANEGPRLKAIVDLIEAKTAYGANATVLRVGDEMSGRLIDILA